MKTTFATYEIAKELKELGFDEPCFGFFNRNTNPLFDLCKGVVHNSFYESYSLSKGYVTAPLWQQCIDYFRENHEIHINVNRDWDDGVFLGYFGHIEDKDGCEELENEKTYEVAREKAIVRAIELAKKNK